MRRLRILLALGLLASASITCAKTATAPTPVVVAVPTPTPTPDPCEMADVKAIAFDGRDPDARPTLQVFVGGVFYGRTLPRNSAGDLILPGRTCSKLPQVAAWTPLGGGAVCTPLGNVNALDVPILCLTSGFSNWLLQYNGKSDVMSVIVNP